MLWQSIVPKIFEEMNSNLAVDTSTQRKNETSKRLDFYHDAQLDYLTEVMKTLFSNYERMTTMELNIVKKVVNNLATVYKEAPTRNINGSEADKELYTAMIENCSLDLKLKLASRYAKLLKTLMVRPIWRDGQLDLDIITGNILDVATGSTPEDVQGVLVTDYGLSEKPEAVEFWLWTRAKWQHLDYRGLILEQELNPYGVIPYLPIWDGVNATSSFWLSGGDDLISQQEAINLKIVDLLYLISNQSFGVGWIKGEKGGGKIIVDPGTLVELTADGEIGFESQEAEIDKVVDAIDKLIKWACVANGLSASTMETKAKDRESGVAKYADQAELNEMRQDDLMLWRVYERKLFDLMRRVHNYHSSKKISKDAKLTVDFADPSKEPDHLKQNQAWQIQLDLGVISPVDIALQLNPDLQTRENALAYLIKVAEENKALGVSTIE